MEIGQKGTITWGDGSKSRVVISDIDSYRYLPTDYWLSYLDGENNKPLKHEEYGINPIIKSEILLPKGLLLRVFEPDIDINSFEYRLSKYIEDNFNDNNKDEAILMFNQLERLAGREYIEENYLKK